MTQFKNSIFSLLLVSIFFTSCNGQTKRPRTKEIVVGQVSFTSKNPKLTKTQGSNEYQDISCGLEDKAGNLWFGTSGEGVYRYDGNLFTQFTEKDGLSSNSVRSILEDKKGNIWFGTNNGLCCYDGKIIKQISLPKNATYQSNFATNYTPSSVNEVTGIMQDNNGTLWFGTTNGIVCYDGNNFSYFLDNHTIINDSGLTLKSVQCMFQDKNGNIWFGSGPMAFEGLALYDGKSLTKFKPKNQQWIRKITEDKNGELLFITRGAGVITYNGKSFLAIPKPMELRNDLLTDFLTDSKGNRWYASDYVNDNDITTGGLWSFDGKSYIEFTKKSGLSNTSVTFIFEDRNRNIWAGTRNDGLYRYDGKTFTGFSE